MAQTQKAACKALKEHGTMNRDQLLARCKKIDRTINMGAIRNAVYNLQRRGYVKPDTDKVVPETKFTLTPDGAKWLATGTHVNDMPPVKKRQPRAAPVETPSLPNISPTAESLADNVAQLLHENAMLRGALVDIRKRISDLLGDTENGTTE